MTDAVADNAQFDELQDNVTQAQALGRSPFLAVFNVIFLVYWIATAAVIAVDPLDLYGWGKPPILLEDYNREHSQYLFSAASKADVDTLLIGGSTTAWLTADHLVDAFPDTDRAFNHSVSGPRPHDRAVLANLILKNSKAKNIILAFDYLYALPAEQGKADIPYYLYDDDWLNDLRLASPTVLQLMMRVTSGQPLALDGWDYDTRAATDAAGFERFQRPEKQAEVRNTISAMRPALLLESEKTCADFEAINAQLAPFAQTLSEQGRELFILIPPYSLAFYALREANPHLAHAMGGRVLSNQLRARDCLIRAVEGLPSVNVYAFDNETWVTADLANYRDGGHLVNPEIRSFMLDAMREGRHRLTVENIDEYTQDLRDNVLRYEGFNSAIDGAHHD